MNVEFIVGLLNYKAYVFFIIIIIIIDTILFYLWGGSGSGVETVS